MTNNKYITKHYPKKYEDKVLDGQFRFGTVQGYKRTEDNALSRLSDDTEGSLSLSSTATPGKYITMRDGEFVDISVEETQFKGGPKELGFISMGTVTRTNTFDAYIACLSRGRFKKARARRLVQNGNTDLSAFVVYDRMKLRDALMRALLEDHVVQNSGAEFFDLFGGVINYIGKEVFVDTNVIARVGNGELTWNVAKRAIFAKPKVFAYEEEYRLLIANLGVSADNKFIEVQSSAISNAIVDYGSFSY